MPDNGARRSSLRALWRDGVPVNASQGGGSPTRGGQPGGARISYRRRWATRLARDATFIEAR